MAQGFDKDFWESHWHDVRGRQGGEGGGEASGGSLAASPHLARLTGDLSPGSALDAGCGEGAEAIWLADRGWRVSAADISTNALARARARAGTDGADPDRVDWFEADLSTWVPPGTPPAGYDLVTTHYAHPAMPQLAFYRRIAEWVAPAGTLLIVGHKLAGGHGHGHGHGHGRGDGPREEASVTAASITALLDPAQWEIVAAEEPVRTLTDRGGRGAELHDVVVRATRRD